MLVAEEMREKHKCKRVAGKVASHQYNDLVANRTGQRKAQGATSERLCQRSKPGRLETGDSSECVLSGKTEFCV